MEEYERHLEFTNGKRVLKDLFGRQLRQWSPQQVAAFLHLYTYQRVDYEKRHKTNRRFRSLKEIYQNGGNCEEKTVFLTSLLQPIPEIDCRFVSVKRDGAAHLLLQIQFTHTDYRRAIQDLARSYEASEKLEWDGGPFYYDDGSRPWLFADPEMSSYLGDVSTLESKGYLISDNDGQWEWTYPGKVVYINI